MASLSGGGSYTKEEASLAKEKVNPAAGMGGSRSGKGRTAKTAVYKRSGKKARRAEGKKRTRME